MDKLDKLSEKIAAIQLEVIGRLVSLEEQIKQRPTHKELSEIVGDHLKPDWAGRTKFIATLIGSGGIGAIILKVVETIVGG